MKILLNFVKGLLIMKEVILHSEILKHLGLKKMDIFKWAIRDQEFQFIIVISKMSLLLYNTINLELLVIAIKEFLILIAVNFI